MIPGKKYTPEDVLKMAWRHKWILVANFVVLLAGSIVFARRMPDQFRSDTVILVVPQRVPENYVRSTVSGTIDDRLHYITQQVLSRARLERIIQDFNLYSDFRRVAIMEDVVEQMRKDIDVKISKGNSFQVGYVSDQPRRAMQVTERLASLFIDESLRDREVLSEGTNQFLESQLEDARRRLMEVEKRIEVYRRQHGNELPTQVESNLQAMNGAQLQFQALVDSIGRDRDRHLILERRAADLAAQQEPEAPTDSPVAAASGTLERPGASGTNAQQLDAARKLLKDLEVRLKPTHPDIKRVQRAIADLERKLETDASAVELGTATAGPEASPQAKASAAKREEAARQARVLKEELESLDRQITAKETQQTRLKDEIAEYQRRAEAAPARESELTELTRDYATIQSLYSSLLGKNEEAKISANLERREIGERFRVLEPARLPVRPFSPNRPRIMSVGGLLGLALGLGLAALIEYRDTTLKSDDDVVMSLALPVLALIPIMRSEAERRRLRRRKILLSMASAATLSVAVLFVVWKLKGGF
jgi:polysaccharide chain length determinant protein (PEP-CTERM system associated)